MKSRTLILVLAAAVIATLVQGLSFVTAPHAAPAAAVTAASGSGGEFVSASGRLLDTRPQSQVGPYNTPMPAGGWRKVSVAGQAAC